MNTLEDYLKIPCEECGADIGESCEWHCQGFSSWKEEQGVTTEQAEAGYHHDPKAGEWCYLCGACDETIYAPTLREMRNQFIKHSLIKPLDLRKCPAIW